MVVKTGRVRAAGAEPARGVGRPRSAYDLAAIPGASRGLPSLARCHIPAQIRAAKAIDDAVCKLRGLNDEEYGNWGCKRVLS